jgi:manganese/iron transport system permease protein
MMEALLSPFQFGFMNNAIAIAVMLSVPAALLSCFLVLKGWALLGDAISHAVLPGVVIAYIINIPLVVGAFIAGMVCALASGFLQENSRVKQDTIMGVVFSGMFGLGIVLYTKIQSDVHLDHILFGNIQGVSGGDLLFTGAIAFFVSLVLLLKRKDFMLHAFDPAQARVLGLPVRLLHYGLLALISLTIVAALKAVGIILTIALLIAPGSIAFLLTNRFDVMLAIAIIVSVISGFIGVYASFFIDSAPAPTIVLVLTLIFIAAFVASTRKAKTSRS